jgi:hypothetical protein
MLTGGGDTGKLLFLTQVLWGPDHREAVPRSQGGLPLLRPNQVVGSDRRLKDQRMMISRSCSYGFLLLILSGAVMSPALAADDNAGAVLADCAAPDLPNSAIDSCLERVRVLDETDPSPQLQSLEAQLEQREASPRVARRQPMPLQDPASPPVSEMAPDNRQPTVVESDHYLPPAAAEPDQNLPAATEQPATGMPDRSARDEQQKSVEAGAERPPAGIDDDLPPVADPPDDDSPSDRSSDSADNPQ